MQRKQLKKKRQRRPLDLALVIGLTEMLKRLARYTSLNLKFADLALIEKYEKGARRKAIKHIRATVAPNELGIPIADPKPKGPNPSTALAKAFSAGQLCPKCHEGFLSEKVAGGKTSTVCDKCGLKGEHLTIKLIPKIDDDVGKFLTDMHKHQILSRWHGLNDPDPPLYGERRIKIVA